MTPLYIFLANHYSTGIDISSRSGVISTFRISIEEIISIGDTIVIFDNSLIKHRGANQENKSQGVIYCVLFQNLMVGSDTQTRN